MELLHLASKIIADEASLPGVAALLNQTSFVEWVGEPGIIELPFFRTSTPRLLDFRPSTPPIRAPRAFNLATLEPWVGINSKDLTQIEDRVQSYAKGLSTLSEHGPSTVLFGGGATVPAYEELVYETAYRLGQMGFGIATGGGGGMMEIANAGAWDSGALSVGIGMGGVDPISVTKVRDKNIGTMGYEVRIPLLLHRRSLVIVAPGSRGTINELATTLVDLQTEHHSVVLLSGRHYRDLDALLSKVVWPTGVPRIETSDSAAEVLALLRQQAPSDVKAAKSSGRLDRPEPRFSSWGARKSHWLDSLDRDRSLFGDRPPEGDVGSGAASFWDW